MIPFLLFCVFISIAAGGFALAVLRGVRPYAARSVDTSAPARRPLVVILPGILFSLMGFIPLGIGLHMLYRSLEFASEGVRTLATVEHFDDNGTGKGTHYRVTYRYSVGPGVSYGTNVNITESTYRHLRIGEGLPIQYLSRTQWINQVDLPAENQQRRTGMTLACWVGAFFVVMGLLSAAKARTRRTIPISDAWDKMQSSWKNR